MITTRIITTLTVNIGRDLRKGHITLGGYELMQPLLTAVKFTKY